jgi:hypothetical protein
MIVAGIIELITAVSGIVNPDIFKRPERGKNPDTVSRFSGIQIKEEGLELANARHKKIGCC